LWFRTDGIPGFLAAMERAQKNKIRTPIRERRRVFLRKRKGKKGGPVLQMQTRKKKRAKEEKGYFGQTWGSCKGKHKKKGSKCFDWNGAGGGTVKGTEKGNGIEKWKSKILTGMETEEDY